MVRTDKNSQMNHFILNRSIKNYFKLISGDIVVKFLGLLTFAFYARYLGKKELFVFPLYTMVADLASITFGFGLLPTMVKMLPEMFKQSKVEGMSVFYTAGLIVIVGSGLFGVLIYVNTEWLIDLFDLVGDLTSVIGFISVGCVFRSALKVLHNLAWTTGLFGKLSIIKIVTFCVGTLLNISLLLKFNIIGLLYAFIAKDVIVILIYIGILKSYLFTKYFRICKISMLFKTSMPFYFESFFMYFRQNGDNWIVTTYLGPQILSVYYVAKKVYTNVSFIFESLDKVFTINIGTIYANKSLLKWKVDSYFQLFMTTVCPGVFVLAGLMPFMIPIIAGTGFGDAVVPGQILLINGLIASINSVFFRIIFFSYSATRRVYFTVVESVVLIASLFILTPCFLIDGIVISRLFSSIFICVYLSIIVKKYFDIKLFYIDKTKLNLKFICLSIAFFLILYLPQIMITEIIIYAVFVAFSFLLIFILFKNFLIFSYKKTINEIVMQKN